MPYFESGQYRFGDIHLVDGCAIGPSENLAAIAAPGGGPHVVMTLNGFYPGEDNGCSIHALGRAQVAELYAHIEETVRRWNPADQMRFMHEVDQERQAWREAWQRDVEQ